MHSQRVVTALITFPILVLYIGKGGAFLFAMLIGAVSLMALGEYYRIVFTKMGESIFGAIQVTGFISCAAIIWGAHNKLPEVMLVVLVLNLFAAGFISIIQFKSDTSRLDIIPIQLQGQIYVPLLLSVLILIRNGQDGITWVLFLLLLVFANDTGAYYAGKNFGNHKLIPSVSPGKTVEGFLGGLAGVMLTGVIFRFLFLSEIYFSMSILMFLLVGIAAPLGDLFESVLKRAGGIKDSGTILPGHGGILDRIDGILFATPVIFIFKEYVFKI